MITPYHRPRPLSTLGVLIRAGVLLTTCTVVWGVLLWAIAP